MTSDLLKYKKNYYSQFGEDGVIEKIFKTIQVKDPWCVEFGAWDGIEFSNTRQLIKNKGWKGVLIEPNKKRFKILQQNNNDNPRVLLINKFVNFTGRDTLDKILNKTKIPNDFDLLSIDIDGNDYHIWESIKKYQPKVVIIEFNPTIPPEIEFIQPKDMGVNQGSSLLSFYKLGKEKGYELVVCTQANAFFVNKKYFKLFDIKDNSPQNLMLRDYLTHFFQLYDGTIVLRGYKRLIWHRLDFTDNDLQLVPKYLRKFPNWWMLILINIYKRDWKWFINTATKIKLFN